ncbi:putative selenate ABC transporter substrate-binding protein [Iodobacter ciconiae]|uniref:Putative selenate ABC transporter substrate-binding protein n=1 Tax=Iodobacter ciconiae TaxID=2496266 RepID=A0A3S8ZTN2_9NEIS|nr:putative selenate ABC transporter substrate-binding protein [Iodobacter ciconiae]AZN36785.1 putative selenate ABC transporter substrate-binding protein [Iodobacter ciconiae]
MKLRSIALVASLLVTGFCQAEEVLRVSAIPDESPTELQRKFSPLGKYLEAELGIKVQFVPVTDYAAVVEALAGKRIDLAWLGGFTFVQANKRGKVTPLVQREEDAHFTSKFITANSSINSLNDLRGKAFAFAFGSASSTSGHLMPRYFIESKGIDPDKDFKGLPAYSGTHDATVAWVASGKVDAGALNASVWDKLVEQKKVDPSKVRVFYTTPPFFDYNWTIRADLDASVAARLKAAFLKLDAKNPAHKEVLDLQRASRFIPTSAENYKAIEASAKKVDLIK